MPFESSNPFQSTNQLDNPGQPSQPDSQPAHQARPARLKLPGFDSGSILGVKNIKGAGLARHRPPQPATGCHRRLDLECSPPPPGLEISAPACTGVPNSLHWLPWWAQCNPHAAKGLQAAAQVSQGLQKSSPADFLRGRRQRR